MVMMAHINLSLPISLILAHFVGDWLLQTNYQALNKSKNNEALTFHVLSYSACFLPWGLGFASWVFITHWITDYFTSRCGTKLWFIELGQPYATNLYDWAKVDMKKRGLFWKLIGADQTIHYITLAILYKMVIHG
jgi:hypothetical protein